MLPAAVLLGSFAEAGLSLAYLDLVHLVQQPNHNFASMQWSLSN